MEQARSYAKKRAESVAAFKVLSIISFVYGLASLIAGFVLLGLSLPLCLVLILSSVVAFCSGIAWNAVEEMYLKLEALSTTRYENE